MTGGHGVLAQEKATVFSLKPYSRNDGSPVGGLAEVKKSEEPERKFSSASKVCALRKKQLHGAPRLLQPGLSSRRSELRVRAGRGGRSARAPRARGRHHPGARQAPPPRGEGRGRRARAASPRPSPAHSAPRLAPPLSFPAKGGPRPGAGAVPPGPRAGRSGRAGLTSAALRPAAKR